MISKEKTIIIICHGRAGTKENSIIKALSQGLYKQGINSYRFDFSGVGESQGDYINTNTTKELSDLKAVVNHYRDQGYRVGLIGHSRGGKDVILYASEDEDLLCIIPISSIARTEDFMKNIFPEQKEALLRGETIYWWENKFGKKYPITMEKVKDKERYKPLSAVQKINTPILFIHGELDKTIPSQDSKELYEQAQEPKKLKIYEKSGHSFEKEEEQKIPIKDCADFIKEVIKNYL